MAHASSVLASCGAIMLLSLPAAMLHACRGSWAGASTARRMCYMQDVAHFWGYAVGQLLVAVLPVAALRLLDHPFGAAFQKDNSLS